MVEDASLCETFMDRSSEIITKKSSDKKAFQAGELMYEVATSEEPRIRKRYAIFKRVQNGLEKKPEIRVVKYESGKPSKKGFRTFEEEQKVRLVKKDREF